MVEFSQFDRVCHPWLPVEALKTACDVEKVNEQISGRAELGEDEETSLGPWLGHSTSLGRKRSRNGDATPTEVSQTDNCE